MNGLIRSLVNSRSADTLFTLFGRPQGPVGVVGERGRAAGRLGGYVASRDSLALDPSRMSTRAQLRQPSRTSWPTAGRPARGPDGDAVAGTPRSAIPGGTVRQRVRAPGGGRGLRDQFPPDDRCVNPASDQTELLDHYEVLVPGTSMMVRYLALQPIYARHPLRRLLTTGQDH